MKANNRPRTWQIFERSSFLHEIGAAINICPNAARVLSHWGFNVELARMVAARQSIVALGSSLKPLAEVDCSKCDEIYGAPWFLAHRVDLHSELRRLATAQEGPGSPADIVLNAKVVGYDASGGYVTLADGSVHGADLIVAADGIHTSAIHHVHGRATPPVSTGSAVFRFLLSTEDLPDDPSLEPHFGDGLMRVMAAEGVRRLVWYPYQGQGGAQAIEDAGALSEIFTRLPANPTADEIRDRLAVFERVRIKRASAIQVCSNVGQDEAWKIREQAQKYMPEGVNVPTSPSEFMEHNFRYDVLKDSRQHLEDFLEKN
ncbi:hypothetical protein APSETT445_000555 [Aspergillus pseudonomiae]